MGHTPTLMDYARFNYVAQPEDRIPPDLLIPRIGPYDLFATRWGYAPIRGARTPDDEKPVLDSWAQMQDSVPWYRFSTPGTRDLDPGNEGEAVGDADPVKSTSLGILNIRRSMALLMPAAVRRGEDNSDLAELYDKIVEQWETEMEHVVNLVGGSESREKYGSQPGPRFTPVSRDRQRRAVSFLSSNAFQTPHYLLDQSVLRRIEANGALRRVGSAQSRVLNALLDSDRLDRLAEYQALATRKTAVYSLGEMLGDVRHAVWTELANGTVSIDPFRRFLQRSYLAQADAKLNPTPAVIVSSAPQRARARSSFGPNNDVRALMRGELLVLDSSIQSALARTSDRTTRLHLLDARGEIRRILDPDN
jgi:hypothetical protein